MNITKKTVYLLFYLILLGGCASNGITPYYHKPVDTIEFGKPIQGQHAGVQSDLQSAITFAKQGDATQAARLFEHLAKTYTSDDWYFEQALLTAAALQFLQQGYRKDFLRVTNTLELTVSKTSRLNRTQQYVLQVARAMNSKTLHDIPGQYHDPRLTEVLTDLLKIKRN